MREKILKALSTSDLSIEEWEDHAHVVASLGASQMGNRRHLSIGAMLLRVRGGQPRFLPRVVELMEAVVKAKSKRERWAGVTPERASTLVRIALDHFLDPNCPICRGVGKIGDFGQVVILCSRAGGGCGGTGKRKADWRGWMERVRDVLSLMETYEGYAAGGTKKQARGGLY
jgi:hypothetical protein